MKKLTLLLFCGSCFLIHSQTPNWHWAKSAQGAGHDYANSISSDANGNCYATGYFQVPSTVFGPFTLTGSTNYHDNLYVAKYDSLGNLIWANTAVGQNNMWGDDIKTDAAGNSYVVGCFQGSGTMTIGSFTLVAPNGNGSSFLAKYSPGGVVLWASVLPVTSVFSQTKLGVDIDGSGNSYVAGRFGSFGADTTLLIKYSSTGSLVWQQYAKGSTSQWSVRSIATDPSGNSYITGQFAATALKFGNTIINNNSNGHLIFVTKYDNAGNVQWATGMGQAPSLYDPAISIDQSGNSFVTGYFNGNTCAFGTTTLSNWGLNDIFLVKLDNQGNILWANRAGGIDYDQGYATATDAPGNVYLTGFYKLAANFGTLNLMSSAHQDLFVAKYNSAGSVLWVKSAGGNLQDVGKDICVAFGKIYVTGEFTSSYPTYGTHTLTNCDVVQNPYEIVVAKLGSGTQSIPTGIVESEQKHGFTVSPQPFSDRTFLNLSETLQNAKLHVTDASGREVKGISDISGDQIEVMRENLSPGVYFFRVLEKNNIKAAGKLIVID